MDTSSSNMAWTDPAALQKYGQEQYQLGKLSVALGAFSQALQLKLPDTVGILDNRAATYIKLGQLETGLRDGRKMIKTDSRDARGYLRCGKILQMMGKPDKALEIYTYGLRTLPSDHPSREMVVQLKDKLQKRMEGSKGVDPFTVLPPEIIRMIFDYFSFKHMVAILRVSRKWEAYLSSLPHLWKHLDLSVSQPRYLGSPKYVSISAMRRYTSRSRSCLTHATLNNIAKACAEKALKNVGRYPQLSYLDIQIDITGINIFEALRTSTNLRTLIISRSTRLPSIDLFKLLHKNPRIEHLEAFILLRTGVPDDRWPDKMPNLRKLSLVTQATNRPFQFGGRMPPDVPGISSGKISEYLPNLEELNLSFSMTAGQGPHDLRIFLLSLTKLRRLSLSNVDIFNFPELPLSLEELYVSWADMVTDFIPATNDPVKFTKLPNLRTLSLTMSRFVSLQFLVQMYEGAEMEVRCLHLSGCQKLSGPELCRLIFGGYLESIQELDISSIANVTDNISPLIIKHMPNLKVLNLNRTQITGVLVKDLVDASSPSIERLHVEECGNLSPDAIKYARGKGVSVISVVRG